jgi:hypothetical protein
MRDRINSKLLDRLGKQVEARNLPPRSDMFISDVEYIDPMKCNVLIGYDAHVAGAPTLSQIERFVEATFNGKIHAQSTTAMLHEPEEAVSVLLTLHADTRPITDATVMRRMLASAYMDDATGSIWQVADTGTHKILVRQSDEDISQIVKARVQRRSRKQASFGRVRQAAPMVSAGDKVRYFDGVIPQIGTVSSVSDKKVTINGKSFPRESVFNVVERSEGVLTDEKNVLQDYWTRAVGNAEWAKAFTRQLNQQSESLSTDTGFSGTVGEGAGKKK